ncbi:hypothetical protein VBD025_07755 [Virgibacillus flavescens]|uniref:hypothetical protein n=1 Tax=Virgibacillus flavescens TaxID=1611422 RepID=UPI003D34873A
MSKIYYYAWGNTAQGLVSFAESNLANLDNVYVLNHPSEVIKTAIINQIIDQTDETCDMEIIDSVNGNEFLDGVILRDKSLAVLTRTVSLPNCSIIDLKSYTKSEQIESLFTKKNKLVDKAYEYFNTGLTVHDDLEKIYINEMDFSKADQLTAAYSKKLIHSSSSHDGEGKIYHRLFGTNTKDGIVNDVPNLIESVGKTYFIKGRAGTGKSTFMKKITADCKTAGFDVELYHCSFDSNSIDMVIVRELDFCIFDSTDPHEFFPEREHDEIIDLYKELVTPRTDEKFADDISDLNYRYKSFLKRGNDCLKEAGRYQSEIEKNFHRVDETEINGITDFISNKVL